MTSSISATGTSTTATTTTTTQDSATVGSALATAIGGGTGIDMTALATNIANAEYIGRFNTIDTKASKLDTQISQASQLKSDLAALSTSLGSLVRGGTLAAAPAVADTTVASASLPSGSAGGTGSYSLEVSALAKAQVMNSRAFTASTATTGSGSLTFTFGTVSGTGFTADSGHAAVTINVAAGATLADVASSINNAGAGVSAYVFTGADGAHLVMKGQEGGANAFTVSASEDPADPGLAALAWSPAAPGGTTTVTAATDAVYKIDGISRTSGSNSIDNVVPGLSLKLTGTNVGKPTTISFSDPSAAIASSMQDLTSALNTIVGELNTDLDPANNGLNQDSAARALSRQLAALPTTVVMPNAASGSPRTLSDLGLKVNQDGTFAFDSTRLTTALTANPGAVAGMFTNGLYGVFGTVDKLVTNATVASAPGSLGASVTRYTAMKATLASQRTALVTQQGKLRTRLVTQFAAANSSVASSKSTLSYLQNQIAAWNTKTN
jgi:flagellar hook-associated protein 2